LGCNGEANKISQHGNAKGKTLKVFEGHSPRPGLRHLVPTFPWPYAPFAGNSNRVSKQVNTVKEGQREKKTIDTVLLQRSRLRRSGCTIANGRAQSLCFAARLGLDDAPWMG